MSDEGASAIGLAERALDLIKELQRLSDVNKVPPYNSDLVRYAQEEIEMLKEANQRDAQIAPTLSGSEHDRIFGNVAVRHAVIERNRRCLMAYHYERLERVKRLRWHHGAVLPPEVRANLSAQELTTFRAYGNALARYMSSIGSGENQYHGLDLTLDQRPPTAQLLLRVRCVRNYGAYETSDGKPIMLQVGTVHNLLRHDCEHLIRQGVLEEEYT